MTKKILFYSCFTLLIAQAGWALVSETRSSLIPQEGQTTIITESQDDVVDSLRKKESFYPQIKSHKNQENLKIVIFGDAGTGKPDQYKVGKAMYEVCQRKGCDFAMTTGDNIYRDGVKDVKSPLFKSHFEKAYEKFGRFDFWMTLGNHDWRQSARAQVDYSFFSERWRMPGLHYAVRNLPDWLSIYALDTEKLDRGQVEIARKYLCNRSGWKLLVGHHPVYSSGKHGDTGFMVRRVNPLIKDCGVHFVFSGHDHHLEHIRARGFQQIITGAGAKLRSVKPRKRPEAESLFARSELGFSIISVSPENIELEFFNDRGRSLYSWSSSLPQRRKPE